MAQSSTSRPLSESLREYGRGIAGGLLFSFPLLYTMEVWWSGFIASPLQLIYIILFTYLLLLGYNRYAGMHPDATLKDLLVDSVEELGLGFLLAFAMLIMLRRVELGSMSTIEIMGKVIIEAMVMSIGISVGTAQLGVSAGAGPGDCRARRAGRGGAGDLRQYSGGWQRGSHGGGTCDRTGSPARSPSGDGAGVDRDVYADPVLRQFKGFR